jgi:hypothetical protein
MKRLTAGLIPMTAVVILFAVGTLYAQQPAGHGGAANATAAHASSEVPEVFCNHMGTGQLCPGNAQMFNLSGDKKDRYLQALNIQQSGRGSVETVSDRRQRQGRPLIGRIGGRGKMVRRRPQPGDQQDHRGKGKVIRSRFFGMKRFRVALPQKQLNGDPYLWRLLPRRRGRQPCAFSPLRHRVGCSNSPTGGP